MKMTYALFGALPILFFTVLYLSVWWFMGIMMIIMVYVAYQFYVGQLNSITARNGLLEQEKEDLHQRLEIAVLKEQKISRESDQIKLIKQQLLSVISHEVRTPMNGVLGMALLLEDTALTKDQHEYIDSIKNSSESLLTTINNILVNDILDFSKLHQEGGQLDYKDFNLRDCVEEVLDLFAVSAGKANLDLMYYMDDNVPVQIIGDNKRLRQVLINLIENALKFTTKGEIILGIHVTPENEKEHPTALLFELRDSGIGISSSQVKQLFTGIAGKEFTKNKEGDAVGLGLVICRKLLELMGGHIEVKSKPEEGSTFTFSIPFTPSLKAVRKHAQQDNMILLEGKTVLIVDDSLSTISVLSRQMKAWKMLPVAAGAGEDIMQILSENSRIGAVLIDLHIPGLDGIELAKSIRNEYSATAVIGMNHAGNQGYVPSIETFSSILIMPSRQYMLRDQLLNIFAPIIPDKPNTSIMMSDEFARQYPLQIMIAEDNPLNQKLALAILNKLGYQPAVAGNGKEALDMVSNDHFDLLFMDIQMPEMDGLEATRMIRSCLDKQPVIIAMTANAMQGDRDACMQAGVDDYMSKPITIKELLSQLEKWALVIRERKSRAGLLEIKDNAL